MTKTKQLFDNTNTGLLSRISPTTCTGSFNLNGKVCRMVLVRTKNVYACSLAFQGKTVATFKVRRVDNAGNLRFVGPVTKDLSVNFWHLHATNGKDYLQVKPATKELPLADF